MPLSMMNTGDKCLVTLVKGNPEQKKFLENLGFVIGAQITVISVNSGNMIVNIKDSRVALGKDMTNKIMVVPE
ncbi:FeoA domain protein [Peptoanaerobacter stomatis]|uniref:FeoA domain protein n=1 Tax=Peptoanaerobacter stomatis TaxID=796937 RepID=J5ULZ4_9FIRM|nr:FeoA family protein [Peptoanaerobacter stomatis]EJU23559.1 FeoA domain protein [Peptoanaerobacter stomatis]NWO24518.1 ferrous iron transport protein A [Peptostreptococcaceae bacterium oral taxon 081]